MKDAAIIGASIACMATAAHLQARGLSTIVFEAHVQPGGCAGFYWRKGSAFDVGATGKATLMNVLTIEKIAIPRGTLVASVFPRTDYADAYRAKLPAGAPRDIDAITRASFSAAPRWVHALMALRDRIVSVIGLKTSGKGERNLENLTFEPGASFGVFRVFARNADEILLGEDDRHLDFRVSVLRQTEDATDWVVVSTVVRFNNWLGRAYFLPVRLFHRLIVPAMIRSAIRKQM
jgi:phytoene dehydrogenase-like protein